MSYAQEFQDLWARNLIPVTDTSGTPYVVPAGFHTVPALNDAAGWQRILRPAAAPAQPTAPATLGGALPVALGLLLAWLVTRNG